MMSEEQIRKAGEILSDPRNQKEEVQALQDTMYVIGGKWKDMEANHLIRRTVTPLTPVLVEYTETDYCMSFGGIILEMISWGKQHREKIKKG